MKPRRAAGVLVLSLAVAFAAPVAAEEPASSPVTVAAPAAAAAPAVAAPPIVPLAGAEGAGWIAAPTPTLVAPLPVAPRVSLAHRWWFWASLGGAAVAVVIAGFTLKPGQPYSGNANPGVVSLP